MISFTSDFIPRLVYQYMYSPDGSMHGFVNHTLSYFNVSHFQNGTAPLEPFYLGILVDICRYCKSDDASTPSGLFQCFCFHCLMHKCSLLGFLFIELRTTMLIFIGFFFFLRYKDYREPPWSQTPYDISKQFWAVLAARLAFVIVFQVSQNIYKV